MWHQDDLTPVVGHVRLRRSATYCIITTHVTCVTSRTSHTCSKFGNSRQCLTFWQQIAATDSAQTQLAATAFSNRPIYYRTRWLEKKKNQPICPWFVSISPNVRKTHRNETSLRDNIFPQDTLLLWPHICSIFVIFLTKRSQHELCHTVELCHAVQRAVVTAGVANLRGGKEWGGPLLTMSARCGTSGISCAWR